MGILVRDENRMAAKSVTEMAFLTLEFPALEQRDRHGIVMNRNKQICRQAVCLGGAFKQARPCGGARDQQYGLAKTVLDQALLKMRGQPKIEIVFRHIPGADST